MNTTTRAARPSVAAACLLLLPAAALGQADLVKDEGVTGALHRANLGRIAFTAHPAPVEGLKEADFLKAFELTDTGDLAFSAFLRTSLTNYLHRLAPGLSADELTRGGSYQLSFLVDGVLVHKDDLPPAAVPAAGKNTKTTFAMPLLSGDGPKSRWSPAWHRFLLNGGGQALTAGKHLLRIELRPYLKAPGPKVGEAIAAGELPLTVTKPKVDETLTAVQPVRADSGWQVSDDAYDKERIRELNRLVAETVYKDVTSVVVVKDGKLLIEEYFNRADRDTLHDIRSAGKSFASTMMGIAIADGHIRGEDQALRDFYDLKTFANYSPKKETVTVKSLLTMSSGFDGDDEDPNSRGNEERMYPTANWVKFALSLPMDEKTGPGERWRYFSAGVVVLGDIVNKSVPGGLAQYADQKLFQPLGISNYKWPYTPQKVPNTAGGLRMRSLDLAKYGQLYRNGGKWGGEQVIPEGWVNKTFTKYLPIPYGPGLYYGYLFWNTTFHANGKPYEAFFATGNGGNKVFVFKDQPLVVVITGKAFGKWYMHRQVDSMMERFILPAVVRNP